jgi:hypothetical protein
MFDFLVIDSKIPLMNDEIAWLVDSERNLQASFIYTQKVYHISPDKKRLLICVAHDLADHVAISGQKKYVLFDGMVFQENEIRDKVTTVDFSALNNPEDDFGKFMYGEYCDKGKMYFRSDALALYPLYVGVSDTVTSVSNSEHFSAQAIFQKNYLQKRNHIPALATALLNNRPPSLETSYIGVQYLPRNAAVIIEGDGIQPSFCTLVRDQYKPISEGEREDQLSEIAEKSVQFVSAFYRFGVNNGNITAGFDSRVVVAMLLKAGIAEDINFDVQGYDDHPDVIVANTIADRFNLKLKVSAPATSGNITDSFDIALGKYIQYGGQFSFPECWMSVSRGGAVLSENKHKWALFNGLPGEWFRPHEATDRFVNKTFAPNRIIDDAREILSQFNFRLDAVSENIRNKWGHEYREHFAHTDELYSVDFYRELSNRYWFGGQSHKNDLAVTIGSNYRLHRLAYCQAPEKRATMEITNRLIESACPELLEIPFENNNFCWTVTHKKTPHLIFLSPVMNTANSTLPSHSYTEIQLRHLFGTKKINPLIFEYLDNVYLESLIAMSMGFLRGSNDMPVFDQFQMVALWGLSLFFDNNNAVNYQTRRVDFLSLKNCNIAQVSAIIKVDGGDIPPPPQYLLSMPLIPLSFPLIGIIQAMIMHSWVMKIKRFLINTYCKSKMK